MSEIENVIDGLSTEENFTKEQMRALVLKLHNNEQGMNIAFSLMFNAIISRANDKEMATRGLEALVRDFEEKIDEYFAGNLEEYRIVKRTNH